MTHWRRVVLEGRGRASCGRNLRGAQGLNSLSGRARLKIPFRLVFKPAQEEWDEFERQTNLLRIT